MNYVDKLKLTLAKWITGKNLFNQAFFWGLGGGYTNYDTDNPTYLEQGYNTNPIVYSVIDAMARKTANIPYNVKKIDDQKSYNRLIQLKNVTQGHYSTQQKVSRVILEKKAFEGDYLDFPLDRPNPLQTWWEFIYLYKTFLKTTGNVYIYMLSPDDGMNKGVPIAVYMLPSHMVQIVMENNADMLSLESPISHYILTEGNSYIEFKQEDIIHIKYANPDYDSNGSHLYGTSPLRAALKNIESSNRFLDLNIKTANNGGAFGFIHGKSQALTVEQAKELKERLVEMDNNPDTLAKIAGVSAEVGFTRISLSTDELKPFDYLNFDEKKIHDVLGWAYDDGQRGDYGGTINEIRKMRITDNIVPDLDLLAKAWNVEFLPKFKGYENTVIEFDTSELPEMQEDVSQLVQWVGTLVDKGVITRNEAREVVNFAISDDSNMDVPTVATDILTLEEAIESSFGIEKPV